MKNVVYVKYCYCIVFKKAYCKLFYCHGNRLLYFCWI